MPHFPLSEVTVIAAALGIFFLIVAFYKSIFHKRPPLSHTAKQEPATSKPSEDQPIKLTDPFQQIPIDSLQKRQKAAGEDFYPKLTATATAGVSAFRQYNPNTGFNPAASASPQDDATYEWE
jgi:hypothetical protein